MVTIPILAPLHASLQAAHTGELTFLVTAYSRPHTANGFGTWFRKQCNGAGLAHCSAHGLRKSGATRAAENGASTRMLMSMFGWDEAER